MGNLNVVIEDDVHQRFRVVAVKERKDMKDKQKLEKDSEIKRQDREEDERLKKNEMIVDGMKKSGVLWDDD